MKALLFHFQDFFQVCWSNTVHLAGIYFGAFRVRDRSVLLLAVNGLGASNDYIASCTRVLFQLLKKACLGKGF